MKKFTKEEFLEMYNKYDSRTLAKICECSVPTVYKYINQLNITKKGRGKGSRQKRKIIIE